MANVSPLDDILNTDVDPSTLRELVGSLEHQLASPLMKESSQPSSVGLVSRNHVQTQAVVAHGNVVPKPTLQTSNIGGRKAPQLQASSAAISVTNLNGGSTIVTSQNFNTHLYSLANCVTTSANPQTVTTSGLVVTTHNPQIRTSTPAMTLSQPAPNSISTPTSNAIKSESMQGKPINTSIASSEHLLQTSQNGGIVNRVQHVQTTRTASPSIVNATTAGNSGIYKQAIAAADQKPLVTTVNHTVGLQDQKFTVNAQPQQLVIKNEPVVRSTANITQQPVKAQPISSVPLQNTAQTVTLVRPTLPAVQRSSQLQILNVQNSNTGVNPRLQGVSTTPKTITSRMQTPVRIAPSQPQPQNTLNAQPVSAQAQAPTQLQGQGNVGCITLPPGFQLPPGAMIVKNDHGQFMVVNAASGVNAASSSTTTLSMNRSAPINTQIVRPSIVTTGTTASTAAATALLQQQQRQQPVQQQQQQARLQSARAVTNRPQQGARPVVQNRPMTPVVRPPQHQVQQPQVRQQQVRQVVTPAPRPQQQPQVATATTSTGAVSAAQAASNQENVKKCKNFLSTLINLAASQPPSTVKNVRELIQGLIDGKVEPEVFTNKLQVELNSSPQPYLVPFLRKSLPPLRLSLKNQEMEIKGVQSGATRIQTTQQMQNRQLANQNVMYHQGRQLQQQQGASTSAPTTTKHLLQGKSRQLTTQQSQQRAHFMAKQQLAGMKQPSTSSGMTASFSSSSSAAVARDKSKYDPALKEDDDINDVSIMGGVDLNEEERNISGFAELDNTVLHTCKDTNFLASKPLLARLNAAVKKRGLDECSPDVANIMSMAVEMRLRDVVQQLVVCAEHRNENYKMDPRFSENTDTRSQLKFLESLDKQEKKRHDEQEREHLRKVARSRTKNEDPEQQKLKEKAKLIQAMEVEQIRQNEANMTALAAIGDYRKKRKLDDGTSSPGGSGLGGQSSSGATAVGQNAQLGGVGVRPPRVKRVTMRDLHFVIEHDAELRKSDLLYASYTK